MQSADALDRELAMALQVATGAITVPEKPARPGQQFGFRVSTLLLAHPHADRFSGGGGTTNGGISDLVHQLQTVAWLSPFGHRRANGMVDIERGVRAECDDPDMTVNAQKILYIDMDNALVDFTSGIDVLHADAKAKYHGDLDEVPGIFATMKPVEGAIEAFIELSTLFDTYILSTAPWKNPSAWSDKVMWVQRYFGTEEGSPAYKRLILSHKKNLNHGDYIVDDRTKNGVTDFTGEHIHFGTEAFPDWASVLAYLKPLA